MITLQEIINTIRKLKDEIKKKYKVTSIGVFGSYIRAEQKEDSDIDILVDFADGADLIDLIELENFLIERLNFKVDVVPKRALREEFKDAILREVAYI
ncbi:MAG: nucleotidyltransferase family protein [Candidatus Helarchaeota archaeon]|nr:nucleotidyltransferase family protein [Candidatus Helarchaeota archaeon]